MNAVRCVWLLALSAACQSRDASRQEPSPLPGGTASADPLGAVALPEMRSCVSKCVERVPVGRGTQKVEEDCRTECYQSCLEQCEREVSERPDDFKKRCREDCERQRQHL